MLRQFVIIVCLSSCSAWNAPSPRLPQQPPLPRVTTSPTCRANTPSTADSDWTRVAALVAVPIAWGTYGPAVKLAFELEHVPPAPVLQASFQFVSFGGLLLAGALRAAQRKADADADAAAMLDVPTAKAGAELGMWLYLGQALQLQGLARTDAARAGFLVQLTTVLVPLGEALLLGRTLPPRLWAACASATLGLGIISSEALLAAMQTGGDGTSMLIGDALVACSALLYTTHVIRLGEYATEIEPLPLARAKAGSQLVYNLVTLSALSLFGAATAGGAAASSGGTFEWAAALTAPETLTLICVALWNGLVPSAFTTWAQTYGQASVPPSAANVLYSIQPVFNAGLAAIVLHEQLDASELIGGALIVTGALLAAGVGAEEDGGSKGGGGGSKRLQTPMKGRVVKTTSLSRRGGKSPVMLAAAGDEPDIAATEENTEVLPQEYFRDADYSEDAEQAIPWDLFGRPQPPVRNAAQDGAFGKPGTVILDCGCGAGDNANWLAARGFDVIGFDLSPSAIDTAKTRAAGMTSEISEAKGAVEFTLGSAIDLQSAARVNERARELGGFEVALDSALLHCLDDEAQQKYVDGLAPLVRNGGMLYVGCFSDRNPDPWKNPRRLSEDLLRNLFTKERGWEVKELNEAWYERPKARSASSGGAWTMAWWCRIERVAIPAAFPVPETPPSEVLTAQLDALKGGDIPRVFKLFSRARRLAIEENSRRDVREFNVNPERVHAEVASMLVADCPGLLGHREAEVVASLGDPEPQKGLLPRWVFRVKVDGIRSGTRGYDDVTRYFVFILTRQSDFDGGDPRDKDGFERCWFVWSIRPDNGGGNARVETPELVPS